MKAVLFVGLVAVCLSSPSTTSAQVATVDPGIVVAAPAPQGDEANLEAWLTLHARRANESRLWLGVIAVLLGGSEIPIESVILATQPPHPADATTTVFATVGITFGVLDLAYGIYRLASPSVQERRLARWSALRSGGPLSSRDLGRFEGEIRGELAGIEDGRWMWLTIGVGLLCAGALGAGLTAGFADSNLGEAMGYSVSGAAALSGVLLAIIPWLDAGADAEWEQIESGAAPRLSTVRPWASPFGGGLTLTGTL
jgi:hypothetical protein